MAAPVSDADSAVVTPYAWKVAASDSLNAQELASWVDGRLRRHRDAIGRLLAAGSPRSIDNTLRPFDDAGAELSVAGAQMGLLHSVYPEKVGSGCGPGDCCRRLPRRAWSCPSISEVYQALAEMDAAAADAATRHYLERTLLQYRLAGVDKDDATRARIKELQDQGTLLGLTFARNVQEGGKTVKVEDAAELEGLPQDYLETHSLERTGRSTSRRISRIICR